MTRSFHAWFLVLLAGCPAPSDDEGKDRPGGRESGGVDTAGDAASDSATDTAIDSSVHPVTDSAEDTGDLPPARSIDDCATVIFGDASVRPALWVNATASAAGDGSEAAPFGTLAEALAVAEGVAVIWVAEGEYDGGLSLDVSGLAVVGKGREATTLMGSDAAANVESNPGEGGGNLLCALTLDGGAPGAIAETGELALYDVTVTGASGVGVVARGEGRSLRLEGVSVEATRVGVDAGMGVMVSAGAVADIRNSNVSSNEGIGVLVQDKGTIAAVRDSRVDANGHGVAEQDAAGVMGLWCESLELDGVELDANVARGITLRDVAVVTIDDCTVTGTDAAGLVANGIRTLGGDTTLTGTTVSGGTGVGLAVYSTGAIATDVIVENVDVAADGSGGVGILLAPRAIAGFSGVVASGNARAGIAMRWSALDCVDCELSSNGQVGLFHDWARVSLDFVSVTDNGYAGLMYGGNQTNSIRVIDSTFGPHPYAAIWAWESLALSGSTVYGSEGFDSGGEVADGFAVYIEGGVDPLEGNEFLDAEVVAVLGAGFLGDLSGNTWNNPGTDFVAVKTADAETIGGLDEIPEYALNPADSPQIVEPPVEADEIWDAI